MGWPFLVTHLNAVCPNAENMARYVPSRLRVILQKKFLLPSSVRQQYAYSRSTCLTAAMHILEFQYLIDEETRPDGPLYQIRWRVPTAVTQDFLLATAVLCQQYNSEDAEAGLKDKIHQRLQVSLKIWLPMSAESAEARKAADALSYVLGEYGPYGLQENVPGNSMAHSESYFTGKNELTGIMNLKQRTPKNVVT